MVDINLLLNYSDKHLMNYIFEYESKDEKSSKEWLIKQLDVYIKCLQIVNDEEQVMHINNLKNLVNGFSEEEYDCLLSCIPFDIPYFDDFDIPLSEEVSEELDEEIQRLEEFFLREYGEGYENLSFEELYNRFDEHKDELFPEERIFERQDKNIVDITLLLNYLDRDLLNFILENELKYEKPSKEWLIEQLDWQIEDFIERKDEEQVMRITILKNLVADFSEEEYDYLLSCIPFDIPFRHKDISWEEYEELNKVNRIAEEILLREYGEGYENLSLKEQHKILDEHKEELLKRAGLI